MKLFGKKEKDEVLEKELNSRINELETFDVDTDEYGKALDNVTKLKKLTSSSGLDLSQINPNTLISCGTTVACVLAMMVFEYVSHGSFTTKAFSFVPKPK